MKPFDIRRSFAALIEETEHPLAPIILQNAAQSASVLGRMLAKKADKTKTDAFMEHLLSYWNDEQCNKICGEPEFIIALAAIFHEACISYAASRS